MIKNIIFDLGNVIVKNPTINLVKKLFEKESDAQKIYDYVFKSDFWEKLDLGQMTNLEVANIIESKKLIEVSNYNEMHNFILNWFCNIEINNDTIEIAKKLKENGYNIYVLSNMAKATYEYLSKKYDFFDMIDGAVISAYEGIKKPNPQIFELLLNRYSLVAEECLLIDDDDTNKTLEVANSVGIKGRRVSPNDAEDVKRVLEENNAEL